MEKIKLNIGDSVELFNGTKGKVINIDKRIHQFELDDPFIVWFHIRNIKSVNEEIIDNDLLDL